MVWLVRALVVLVCLLGSAPAARAATATWNASLEPNVAGYIVSYGTASGVYTTRLNVGNVTSVLIALTPGVQYFLVCQSYNTSGVIGLYSTEVVFTVDAGSPVFDAQPTSLTVMSGQSGSFRAAATGEPSPTYRWQVSTDSGASWTNLANTARYSGVTTDTLTVVGPTGALTGTQYRAVAKSSAGTTPSNAAMLTVEDPTLPGMLIPQTSDAEPFGSFDTPFLTSSNAQGSVELGGWALANGSLDRVEIWRDPMAGDTNQSQVAGPANGKIFVANAGAIHGARPDVEAWFSSDPQVARTGWGYLLETRGLAGLGDGVYTLYAIAHAAGGVSAILGTRTLVVDNATATLPFGTLDTPAESATVAGMITVAGWALTRESGCTISTVGASIDSGPVVPVLYGQARPDIAARFPGFINSDRAGGSVVIDTTTLTNGAHQMSWSVTDSCGRQAWIGTRFFVVQNGVSTFVAPPTAVTLQSATVTFNGSPIAVQESQGAWSLLHPGVAGVRVLQIDERGSVNVDLGTRHGATYAGYHRVGSAWRPLPLGSSLNRQTGLFSWEPAAGFVGNYDLAFVATATDGTTDVTSVRIVVGPSVRLSIDAPPARIQQPFELTGWTLDLAALDEAGIETAEVWASPTDGGNKVLVGTATTGEARPDVAAIYGAQFANSGFRLVIDRLSPGTYDLVFSARAVTSGPLRDTTVLRVTVH